MQMIRRYGDTPRCLQDSENANVTQSHSHAVTLDWMKMKNQKDT